MSNKLHYFFSFTLFLFFIILPQYGKVPAQQLTAKLIPPPTNQLKSSDLWKVELINPNRNEFKITVSVDLKEKVSGIQATCSTKLINIVPGSKRFSFTDFNFAGINYRNPKLQEAFGKNLTAPDGNYTMCVYVKNEKGVEIARDCIELSIVSPKLEKVNPQLISPANKSELYVKRPVVFTWMLPSVKPATDITYKIKVVEILGKQTAQEAITRNPAVFEKDGIRGTTFNYPASAKKLSSGKAYTWQVVAYQMNNELGKSETNTFKSGHYEITIDSLKVECSGNEAGEYEFKIWITNPNSASANLTQLSISNTSPNISLPNLILISPATALPIPFSANQQRLITGKFNIGTSIISQLIIFAELKDQSSPNTKYAAAEDTSLVKSCTCCGDLVKRVRPIYNGGDVMTVSLQAYPKKIKKVSVQLVYVNSTTQDGCPVCKDDYRNWGNFGGNHSNSINGLQLTSQHNRELIWGSDNTEPKDFSTPVSINVGMKLDEILASNFPEVLKPCCKTKVDYCIRYSFTTEDCITCDTLICSTVESGVPVAKKQAQIENESGIKSLPQNGKKQSNNRSSFPGIIFFPLLGINYKRIRDYLRTLFDCRFTFLLMTLSMLYATVNYAQPQPCTSQVEIGYQKLECFNEVRAQNPAEGKDQFQHVAACMNQPYTYSALGTGWTSYNWSATGPSTVNISPDNTSQSISITWQQPGEYTLILVATDGQNNTSTRIIKIDVKEKPVANFTFTPSTGCTGTTIAFTNTTTATGSVAYIWDFGDGHSSDQENPNHIYNSAGIYNITLIAFNFDVVIGEKPPDTVFRSCCADTIKKTVTINDGQIRICVSTVRAGERVTYTATGCNNITWLQPTGSTEYHVNENQITIAWGDGSVQGAINAQCADGCAASVAVPIIPTHPQPEGNLSPCAGSVTSYTLPLLPGTFYEWHLNGGVYDSRLSTHPENNTAWIDWGSLPAGIYQLSVKLINKHLCDSTKDSISITLKESFKAWGEQTICVNSNASLYVSPNLGTFEWSIDPTTDVSIVQDLGNQITYHFNRAGIYTVTVNENASTYCNSTKQIKITVVKNPSIDNVSINGPDKVCPGPNSQYTYTMSSEAPTGYCYSWSIVSGDGVFLPGTLQTFTGNSATIKWNLFPPPFPGKIKVVLKSYSLPDCPNGFIEKVITEATLGSITGATSVCADDIRTYSVNVPAGEVITWSITQAESGSIIAGQGTDSITVQWHGSSTSSSTLIATGCGTIPPLTINVCRPTEGTITQYGTDFCAGISLEAGQGTNYQWFHNGSEIQSTNNIQSISITQPGNYSVKYDIACGCKATKTIVVTNPSLCQLLLTTPGPTVYCLGSTTPINTQLIATDCQGYNYKWYKDGNEISGATALIYMAQAEGTYYVKATRGIHCAEQSNSIIISRIECVPCGSCVPYVGTHNISQGSTCNNFNFSTTGYPNVTWYFGDGQIGSGITTTHVYQSTGYFPVKIVVPCQNNDQCTQVFEENVFVPLAPDFSSLVNCSSVQFTDLTQMYAGGTITQRSWEFGDGSTSTQVSPTHNYSQPGNYQVKLTVTYSGNSVTCTSSITHTVTITAPAQPTINFTSPICAEVPITFSTNASPSIMNYKWTFDEGSPDQSFSYAPTVQHSFLNPGNHTATLTVTDYNGCANSQLVHFVVKSGISNCTIEPVFICPGGSATLTAPQGNGYTYQWQRLEGSIYVNENSTNNTLTVTTPGWYRVIITNAEGCQCISEKVEVKTNPKPIASLSVSPTAHLCGSGYVTISNISKVPGDKYAWFANGTPLAFPETLSTIVQYVTTNTTFQLIITNQFGCKDTCEITVYSNLPPSQPNINPTSACEGQATTFIVEGDDNYCNNITWNTGTVGKQITVSAAGVYTATYTDPSTGCTSSRSVVINAKPPVDLFPSGCDSATCECTVPFTIYAPKPLMGYPQNRYIITWYSATNPNPIGTGAAFSPAQTGSYYIIIKDLFTGCESKSETYSIVVPQCDSTVTSGCCDNFNIRITSNNIIQNNNGVVLTGQVSAGPAKIRAVAISIADFTVSYNDGDVSNTYCSTCAPNSSNWGNFAAGTAQLITGLNPGPIFTKPASAQKLLGSREIIWGSQNGQAINLTNANINVGLLLPPLPTSECCKVTYNICVRYKFTDENCLTCDTLICYSFVPSQPTPSICDCGRWGKIKITSKGGKTVEKDCGDVPIEINDLNPGVPHTFTPTYICNSNSSDCRVTYKYSIQKDLKPVFLPFAGSFNYTPDKIGLYKICIQAFCNDKLCGTCCVDLYVGHQKSPPKE